MGRRDAGTCSPFSVIEMARHRILVRMGQDCRYEPVAFSSAGGGGDTRAESPPEIPGGRRPQRGAPDTDHRTNDEDAMMLGYIPLAPTPRI